MNKLSVVVVSFLALGLAGCNEEELKIIEKWKVVAPPESLYNCPQIKKYPKVETLTELQVAKVIVDFAEANKICGASMASLKKYYQDAKVRIEGPQSKKARKKV